MASLKIVLLCIVSAVVYGILHDQVTARVCVEYFTIGHPPIFGGTHSPTLLALGWGIIATWWVGLPLGVILAAAARLGSWPRRSARQMLPPLLLLLLIMGLLAVIAGITGYWCARQNTVWLLEPLASAVPPDHHAAFLADLWAHLSSYASGVLGGLALALYIFFRRLLHQPAPPRPTPALP